MPTDFFKDKSILVTGGTGSFGRKFVQTLLTTTEAKRVIVFSRDEFKQSQMLATMNDPGGRLRFFIGDVRDLDRLRMAFREVDFVVHAAALKQVPALEYNPFEAIKTNIIGTQNVITAAIEQEVEKVVLISTDKAANPANLYGATKLCAERLMISSNAYTAGHTRFAVVRYGNVIGSRGSIAEVIAEQKKAGVVTITHEEMTRFWITLDQGINLVLLALEKMQAGEIFIPKVPSMKIKDFFMAMAPGCAVKVIGIRPGEKIHEVLVTPEEARHAKEYQSYFVVFPEHHWWAHQEKYSDGADLPSGFQYASHTNTNWLDEETLKNFLLQL